MSAPKKDENLSSQTQLSAQFFGNLVDSIIADVASECHRVAWLGMDGNLEEDEEELRLSAEAEAKAKTGDPSNSGETNSKNMVDIFGQTHPAVAAEVFQCMHCKKSVVAGRFAPHLENCMGKGRKARRLNTITRSKTAGQNQNGF